MKYRIYECNEYLLVVNVNGRLENHSHFSIKGRNKKKVLDTCNMLIKLIEHRRIPRSDYLLQSAIRLTTYKRYKAKLLKEKERRLKKLDF